MSVKWRHVHTPLNLPRESVYLPRFPLNTWRFKYFISDPAMDGKNQWPMISEGHASARTEFVYNIDQIANCSAIRFVYNNDQIANYCAIRFVYNNVQIANCSAIRYKYNSSPILFRFDIVKATFLYRSKLV